MMVGPTVAFSRIDLESARFGLRPLTDSEVVECYSLHSCLVSQVISRASACFVLEPMLLR